MDLADFGDLASIWVVNLADFRDLVWILVVNFIDFHDLAWIWVVNLVDFNDLALIWVVNFMICREKVVIWRPKLFQVGSKTAQDGPRCGHARQILVSLQDSHYFLRCDTQRESRGSRRVAGKGHTFVGRGP